MNDNRFNDGNQLIANFLGYKLIFVNGINTVSGKPKRELHSYDPDGRLTMLCPSTMYGSEDDTYNKQISHELASYGRWGSFHKDWNKLMPAIKKFSTLPIDDEKFYAICQRIDESITSEYLALNAFYALVSGLVWYAKR